MTASPRRAPGQRQPVAGPGHNPATGHTELTRPACRAQARLDGRSGPPHTPPTSRIRALIGTSTRRAPSQRPGGWCEPGWRRRRMDPGAPGPNAGRRPWTRQRTRTQRTTSRLRRRAPAIQGSADRSHRARPAADDPSVTSAAQRRTWVAPRKDQRPFVPEETNLVVSDSRQRTEPPPKTDRPAQPHRDEAPGLHRGHHPPARDAHGGPGDADRRVPPAGRRHHARLPAGVRRGRRAPRPVQLPGHRPAAPARGRATASPARPPAPSA